MFERQSDLLQHCDSFHKVQPNDGLFEKLNHFKRQNAQNIFNKSIIDSNEMIQKDFRLLLNSIRSDVLN